ncbi:MAG: penicillin acylase family protein [Cyclobacteriaceae bacterium]
MHPITWDFHFYCLKLDFFKLVDGSNPATDWQGLHTVDKSIVVHNPENGWIQNCNSTPFTASGAYSPKPEKFPAYMAPDAENFGGVHAYALATAQPGFLNAKTCKAEVSWDLIFV